MNSIAEHLKKVPLFDGLDDAARERLAAACRCRTYAQRVHLFYEGDQGGQIYMVLRGGVKIYADDETGQEIILDVLTKGDHFGEMALLTGGKRTASAMTIADGTELLLLDQERFHAVLSESFELCIGLLVNLANRLKRGNERLLPGSSRARIAKLLLARADPANGRLCPPLTQEEIANFIGRRRETVARILADMEKVKCLLRNRGQIHILDRLRLERIAETS